MKQLHGQSNTAAEPPVVLLIEDDPGDAALIQFQLLEPHPNRYHIQHVESLIAAHRLLDGQQCVPDVILLDLNLPDASGIESIRACQRLSEAPIVVLTGLDDDAATRAAIESGAEDYLPKGGEPALLHRAISYAILRHRREADARLAATVFTHAREGVMIADVNGLLIDVNQTFCQLTGYTREEVIGHNPRFLKSGKHSSEFYENLWQQLLTKGHWYGEIWNRRKDGEVMVELLTLSAVYDARGRIRHFVGMFSDITLQKEHERQLELIAHHDALTGLPNRLLMADRIRQAMAQAKRTGRGLALAYIDLDGFKGINDRYGHQMGDQLLVAIAKHMKGAIREGDTIARLGGDEFVAVLSDQDLSNRSASLAVITRLLEATTFPIQSEGTTLRISGSIGLTFYPQAEEVDADQLLRQADQAMYQAKQTGRSRYHVFDAEHERTLRHYHERIERIRQGLEQGEFLLHYQPKVNMRTGQVVGVEALIRWQHPERGLLYPISFLPLIENHPLENVLGAWVLNEALRQLESWSERGLLLPISVNISAHHLQHPQFMDQLRDILEAHHGLPVNLLSLEVLETSALADMGRAANIIQRCSRMGISFALDDFGTGYSSLTYLKRLPVDLLKIDQSFVRDMLHDPDDFAILEGVLGLARAFHRGAIAEGVESEGHGRLLLQLGCELAQGYGISPPMPPEQLPDWLGRWSLPSSWKNVRRWPGEALPALAASVEHRAWIKHLHDFTLGICAHPPVLDPKRCRLGLWLNELPLSQYIHHGGHIEAIQLRHREVHELGEALMTDLPITGSGGLDTGLQQLFAKRDELIELLGTLY